MEYCFPLVIPLHVTLVQALTLFPRRSCNFLSVVSTGRYVYIQAAVGFVINATPWRSGVLLRAMAIGVTKGYGSTRGQTAPVLCVDEIVPCVYHFNLARFQLCWNMFRSDTALSVLRLVLSRAAVFALVQYCLLDKQALLPNNYSNHPSSRNRGSLSHLSSNANKFSHSSTVAHCHTCANPPSQPLFAGDDVKLESQNRLNGRHRNRIL